MKNENGFWVDEDGNRWEDSHTSKEQAFRWSKTMINCTNCKDCTGCINCKDCIGCDNCKDCTGYNYFKDCITK